MRNLLFFLTLLLYSSHLSGQEFIQAYPDAGTKALKISQPGEYFNILTQNQETNAWNSLNISNTTGDVISIAAADDNSLNRNFAHQFFYQIDTIQNGANKDIKYSKYAPDGTFIWEKTLELDLDNFGIHIVPTTDNNLLLGGVTQVGSDTLYRLFLTKMTQDGDVLWHRIMPKSVTQYDRVLGYIIGLDGDIYTLKEPSLSKIYPTKDGGYLIRNNAGYNGGGVLNLHHNWIKTDEYGRVIWSNSILAGSKNISNPVPSTGYIEYANGMVDSWEDGSVVIAYNTKIGTSSWSNAPVVKYNPAGEVVFSKSYNGHSWRNYNYGVTARPNGGMYHVLYHGDLASSAIGMTRNVVTVFGYSPNADGSSYLTDANYVLDWTEKGFINSSSQEYNNIDYLEIHDFKALDDTKFVLCGNINSAQGSTNFNTYGTGTGGAPFVAMYDLEEECNTYEKDFTFFGEFEGHTYFLSDIAYPLSEMEGVAAGIGGYLASINSKGENDFLIGEALGGSAIIGLSDAATEGTFVWADGNPVNFNNFPDCLPDCENTEDLDYANLNFGSGEWSFATNPTGNYRFVIEVDCNEASTLLPDLTVSNITALPIATSAGNTISFEIEVNNQGSANQTGAVDVKAYLSLDSELSEDDFLVANTTVSDLAMTNSVTSDLDLNIPTDINGDFYHLILVVDEDDNISESNTNNNFHFVEEFFTYSSRNLLEVLDPGIDIRLNYVLNTGGTLIQGEDYIYPLSISNYGNEDLSTPIKIGTFVKFGFPYLTTNEEILAAEQWGEYILTDLPAGTTDTIQLPITVPLDAPYGKNPLLHFYADYDNQLEEVIESNNTTQNFYYNMNIGGENFVELDIQNVTGVPASMEQGETFNFSFQVVNTGTLPAEGEFAINITLATTTWGSPLFGYDKTITLNNLAPGASQNISTSLTAAPHTYPNDYHVRFSLDVDNNISEASETNNDILSIPVVTIGEGANPDLTLSNLTEIPDTLTQGDVVFFYFDIENIGEEVAAADYNIKMYLEQYGYFNPQYESDYLEVGIIQTGWTPPGTIPDVYGGITVPEGFPPGNYQLMIVMDANSDIDEKVENNNYISTPVYIKSITDDFAWDMECPEDIVVQIGNETETIVNWDIADISTANNCSEDLTINAFGQSLGFCPGGLFPIGVETIEYGIAGTCFDTYAEASCQFTVTVVSHPIYTVEESVTICAGDTYEGTEYFVSTVLSDTLVYPDFDSVFVTNITVLENYETFINLSSCNPEDVGTYTLLLTAQNGCDSLIVTEVVYDEVAMLIIKNELCSNESLIVNGTVYDIENPTGEELFPGGSVNGCDSIVGIDLTFIEVEEGNFMADFCQGESILINGTVYDFDNPTGEEIFPNASYTGCDSTLNVNLNFLMGTSSDLSPQLCPGESIEINGTIYDENNQTGIELLNELNQYGCDSTLNISVEMLEDYNLDLGISLTAGETYNDVQIFNDTLIVENYTSIDGCDSIVNVMIDVMTVANENVLMDGSSLTLFPNPTMQNEVNIILESTVRSDWKIRVLNTLGQTVYLTDIKDWSSSNSGNYNLKVDNLATGTYFISAERTDGRLVRKLVVL